MQNLSIARKTITERNLLQHFRQQQRGHLVQLGLSLRLEAIKAMQRQQVAVESLRALRDVLLQRTCVWLLGSTILNVKTHFKWAIVKSLVKLPAGIQCGFAWDGLIPQSNRV